MCDNDKKFKTPKEKHECEIKQIISSQSDEINKIKKVLSNTIGIYKEYISLSKEFSRNLETLAMKLKPDDKTFEGRLIQVFQGTLLFNSNSLNDMIVGMNKIFSDKNNKDIIDYEGVEAFQNITQVYFEQYNKTMDSYKVYESDAEHYENYLIKKELGLIKEDSKNDTNLKGASCSNNNHKNNHGNNHGNSHGSCIKLYDNHKSVFLNQQKFVNNMRACNDILKNLFDYFIDEKNKLRNQIVNYCHSFNDNALEYLKKQNETCLNQKALFDELNENNNINELEEKNLSKHFLKPNLYSLKCLKMADEAEDIIKKNKLYSDKKLSVEQSLHILQTFRSNGLILNQQDESKEKEEHNKQEISDIVDMLFNKTFLYDDSHRQKLINLFNEKIYQLHFLKLLNKYRSKGKFSLSKTALKKMGYLFQYLNELIIKSGDINLFKLFFIMSLTFYYQDSESFKKYYLLRYVENHQSYKDKKFWENYLSGLIQLDIELNKKCQIDKDKEEWQDINYITFTNIISVTKSMSDFHLGKDFINDFFEDITKNKYNLNEEQKTQINYLLIDNEFGSFNENDRSTLSTEINDNQSLLYTNSLDNNLSDNNLIRTSNVSNNLNNTRNSSISNNYLTDINLSPPNNNSNNLKLNKSQNESDEGSGDSIEIEEINKNA